MTDGATTRADELIAELALKAAGVRATVDPGAFTAPGVLLVPIPGRRYDLGCGYTSRWRAVVAVPSATATTRVDGDALNELITAVCDCWPVFDADVTDYVINGVSYPAAVLTWEEALE